jgi:hypothetical protein
MTTRLQHLLSGAAGMILLTAFSAAAQMPNVGPAVACSECHACKAPSADDPCLRMCPRPRIGAREFKRVADVLVMNELENEYERVVFPHKLHAEMTAMGVGCTDCHHYTATGEVTACKHCHPVSVTADNLRRPGLKGAYHRQCLGCHGEWSGSTGCEVCHARKSAEAAAPAAPSPRPHPLVEPPVKKVWESRYGGGTKVTFFHASHVEKYGIECAVCHHTESCGSCHSRDAGTTTVRHSEEALHAICNSCHAQMSCGQCHRAEEAVEFSHDSTGWPLRPYHRDIACRLCHGHANRFVKPSPECNGCHAGWSPATFTHSRTGFVLDDVHHEFGCEECHPKRAFADPPVCTNCHEADYTFPAKMPGSREGFAR